MGLVRSCGAIPVYLGIARDNNADLLAKLTLAVQMDVIVTTGGVSVGDFDLVKEALRQAGTDMKFWRVRMKPGRPQAFGTIGGKPTFGLPGNPVSTMVSFEMFVRPALRKMMGHLTYDNPYIRAVAGENIHSSKGRVNLLRARLERREDELLAFVTGRQTSGILTSMAAAHGLILVPADIALIEKGSTVTVLVLDWEFMNSPWPL
jgi:molybdopterin molybdotransferase